MSDQPSRAVTDDSVSAAPLRPVSARDLIDSPRLMLVMLFFVTAALGLPFLWLSRGFSPVWKFILTIVVLAWTAFIFWLFWLVMAWTVPTIATGLEDLFGPSPFLTWLKHLFT